MYIQSVLRGSRSLKLCEARSIAGTLRSQCGKLFPFSPGLDRLPLHLQDGLRYADTLVKKQSIQEGIGRAKRAGEDRDSSVPKRVKRLKEVYLVSKVKFHSVATEAELNADMEPHLLDSEDGHRIVQAKIRYRKYIPTCKISNLVFNSGD